MQYSGGKNYLFVNGSRSTEQLNEGVNESEFPPYHHIPRKPIPNRLRSQVRVKIINFLKNNVEGSFQDKKHQQ